LIKRLKGRGLKRLHATGERSGIGGDLVETVEWILTVLDSAASPADVNVPYLRLHALKGDLHGYWAITVRANWRIIFRFEDGDVVDVELVDYH
jgi:proteic killer suppression protein